MRARLAGALVGVLLAAGCGGDKSAETTTMRMPTLPPPPASTGKETRLGPTRAGETVEFSLLLRVDEAGIRRYLADVADPDSPRYRRFLTAAQYGERFGLAPRALAELEASLERRGFRVGPVNPQRTTLPVRGTARATSILLRTELVDYRDADGHRYHEPSRPPTVPRGLRSSVVAVSGLGTRSSLAPAALDSPRS